MTTALLLIDLQIDFLSDTGRMPVGAANAERVIRTANRLIQLYEEQSWPIFVICNQFKKTDVIANIFRKHAALEGSEGGKLDPRICIRIHDGILLPKARSSAFSNPDFSGQLKKMGIEQVVICGVYAEGCVRATALDAQRANLRTILISDGVASNREFKFRWALSHLQKRAVQILSLEGYLDLDSNNPAEPVG